MSAKIILGLSFGDEGKGITTDHLCSESDNPIVVRFSGGPQAGHTVMKEDGRKHTFSSFGAGTFRGVPTYFTEDTCIYLNTMENEKLVLNKLGYDPKLIVHPLAKMITPYDVAYNRLLEKRQGHGSVGLGIAATNKRHTQTGYKLHAVDYLNFPVFKEKLDNIKFYYLQKVKNEGLDVAEWSTIVAPQETYFIQLARDLEQFITSDYRELGKYDDLIFEGSQGIMLDMDHGIFPNVTWGNTTSKNAIKICEKIGSCYGDHSDIEVYYITRCYQTRHGNGWMSNSQEDLKLIRNEEEINVTNEWQGNFKTAELDYHLLNYALSVDKIYSGNTSKNLVVTCLDQRPDFEFDPKMLNMEFDRILESRSPITSFSEQIIQV